MSDSIELVYFDVQGRATIIRILLRIAGCDWKDTVISPSKTPEWLEMKKQYEEEALGKLVGN